MPPFKYNPLTGSNWGSNELNHEANILHYNSKMRITNMGRTTGRLSASTFPNNDGALLVNDIYSAKEVSLSSSTTAAATARARVPPQPEIHEYLGRVKAVRGNDVIVEIGPPDRLDRWDVIIPRTRFAEEPQVNHEIACKIARFGSHTYITVQDLSKEPLPELKDFGIDEEELLSWASQSDV